MSENLTPWAERDINQLREWHRLRVEAQEQYDREGSYCQRTGQYGDDACRKCGHVMCSCTTTPPQDMCPRCEHAFDDDDACHNALCGVEETDWADDIYPCGPWRLDQEALLPGDTFHRRTRRALGGSVDSAFILRFRNGFRWIVRRDFSKAWGGRPRQRHRRHSKKGQSRG